MSMKNDKQDAEPIETLPEDYYLENLGTYLKQLINEGGTAQPYASDEFIKVYDLRKGLLNLNCQGLTADDVDNLTNVLAKKLVACAELYINEDGESQAIIKPSYGTHSINTKDISEHFLSINDVISSLKEIA